MKRIIFHWTAGTHKASSLDREHYHRIFEGNGTKVLGRHAIEDNRSTRDGDYAAHTLGCNTDSIGLAVACMFRARAGRHGKYPMTRAQFDAMVKEAAKLCVRYGIPVMPTTTLWHAEVEQNLGIKQRGKWDATELSFEPKLKGAKSCGSYLRSQLAYEVDRLRGKAKPQPGPAFLAAIPTETPSMLGNYSKAIGAIVGAVTGWAVSQFGLPAEWASPEINLAVTTIITTLVVYIFPANVKA